MASGTGPRGAACDHALTDELTRCAGIPQYDAMKWLGVVIVGISLLCVAPLYWPMWGGMLMPAKQGYTEEDYYYNEYTAAEREKGLHLANSAFVRPVAIAAWGKPAASCDHICSKLAGYGGVGTAGTASCISRHARSPNPVPAVHSQLAGLP